MFTAHIDINGKEQSVEEHLLNTSILSYKYASKIGLGKIAELQGMLHDIGKLTEDFNCYIHGDSKYRRGELDHSFAGAKYLFELAEKMKSVELTETARIISHTIISHHGIHDWIKDDGKDYFEERIAETERYNEIIENYHKISSDDLIIEKLRASAEEYCNIISKIKLLSLSTGSTEKNRENFSFYNGMLERFLQSFLIDADRTDTASFISGESEPIICEKNWKLMKANLEEKLGTFSSKQDKISLQRKSISERCEKFADHEVGVCRLIVPTGGGKTLSSLRFAIEYCNRYDKERIFYIAPFMSILEQNSDEIRSITGDEIFLEHHSNVLYEIKDDKELAEYQHKIDKWDMPVIATTLVQFLNTLFSNKTSSVRRFHQLSNSVIIIDEVQSIPLFCVNLFNLAMNFLSKICGCTVVLCSATQPTFDSTDTPLIYDERRDMTGDYYEDFNVFRRTELIPEIIPGGYSYEQASSYCYEKFQKYGSSLIIVNTKEAASKVYKNIRSQILDDTKVVHLSTNMCPKHRKDVIAEIRNCLNKGRKIICVTTQLIEAGVDISFACVIRSLSGMDNAAQAAGRCNRHGERGEVSPVFIININEEKIKYLKEIQMAQCISEQIFENEKFDEYLSPETMAVYFNKLFQSEKNNLSYTVKEKQTTILDLLSLNKKSWDIYKKSPRFSSQAFETAGKAFEVICSDTYGVLIPYNEEADNLILDLNDDISNEEFIRLSRKAQKYTVSLYAGQYRKLKDSQAVEQLKSGVVVLRKNYFDMETGINSEGIVPELMIY